MCNRFCEGPEGCRVQARGFTRVRHCECLSPAAKKEYERVRSLLRAGAIVLKLPAKPVVACPCCGAAMHFVAMIRPSRARPPPSAAPGPAKPAPAEPCLRRVNTARAPHWPPRKSRLDAPSAPKSGPPARVPPHVPLRPHKIWRSTSRMCPAPGKKLSPHRPSPLAPSEAQPSPASAANRSTRISIGALPKANLSC